MCIRCVMTRLTSCIESTTVIGFNLYYLQPGGSHLPCGISRLYGVGLTVLGFLQSMYAYQPDGYSHVHTCQASCFSHCQYTQHTIKPCGSHWFGYQPLFCLLQLNGNYQPCGDGLGLLGGNSCLYGISVLGLKAIVMTGLMALANNLFIINVRSGHCARARRRQWLPRCA